MHKIIKWLIVGIVVISISTIPILINYNKKLKEDLSIATANIKAYVSENSSLKKDSKAFQLTIEQLNYYNDSIIQKLNEVRKELKIKDKDLKSIQYINSEVVKIDTIEFRDTIFKKSSLSIDTIFGDEWYKINLKLKYPNTIITTPKFISEKYIIVDYKKETINPPNKCWLLRLFQKKHKVVRVEVVEKNPYINNKQQKYIEIIK